MPKSFAWSLGVTVALGLWLASSGSSAFAQPAAPSGGTLAWALTAGDERAYQDAVNRYNQRHPDAKITLQLFPNDPYKQKLLVAIGAGNPPDLFFNWGGGILKSYVDAGYVMDLTAELGKDAGWKKRFFSSVLAAATFGDKLYGVPVNGVQPVVLYYNKKVFQDVGAQPPKTWNELLAAIPKFKAKGKALLSVAGADRWTYLMYAEYLVDRIGGPQVFADIVAGKPDAWSNPAVITAGEMIQTLVKQEAFVKGYPGVSYGNGQATALLYTGRAGMQLMGTWDYPNILNGQKEFIAKDNLGWLPFPTVDGGKGNPADVAGNVANFYSVSAKSTHKAAAIELLKTDVLSDSNIDVLLKNGSVPPVIGLEAKLAKMPQAGWLSFVYSITKTAPSFQLSWDQALPPAEADALLTNLEQLFLMKITPKQLADNMNKAMKR
jgi:raffinose/stachyose/melibiose transport system substrate-binding protein